VPTRILGVIPARFASTRFPGKALARIAGKSMLEHVFERAAQARYLTNVVIATDDERIRDEAQRFHAPVRMTRSDHVSGTDRVAEVASAENAQIIVNIQGDEPLIDPAAIDATIPRLLMPPCCLSWIMLKYRWALSRSELRIPLR
jgi:3-deoxy-manno-octulosonate cytidylyltransferase (CMP-KDO synthetase)